MYISPWARPVFLAYGTTWAGKMCRTPFERLKLPTHHSLEVLAFHMTLSNLLLEAELEGFWQEAGRICLATLL